MPKPPIKVYKMRCNIKVKIKEILIKMRANPIIVEEHLKGIHYPANREDLLKNAKKNDAPSEVVSTLGRLPAKEYTSPIDVNHEIGKLE